MDKSFKKYIKVKMYARIIFHLKVFSKKTGNTTDMLLHRHGRRWIDDRTYTYIIIRFNTTKKKKHMPLSPSVTDYPWYIHDGKM